MKYLPFLAFFFAANVCLSQAFITTWKTNNPGTSCNSCITIPTTGTGYNYDVDWDNDGIYDEFGITGNVTHDFGTVGIRTIRITGNFPRIYFNNGGDCLKILSIDQWGTIAWTSMLDAFEGAENLTSAAVDTPDLSGVLSLKNMSSMFYSAKNFTSDLSSWDVSKVVNMSEMFRVVDNFTSDLSNWDVSKVRDMSSMFDLAKNFTSDLSTWDVSNVITMTSMFTGAESFNKNISNWDVSKVTDMSGMFTNAKSFDQNIGGWNIEHSANLYDMLRNSGLSTINYDSTLIGWDNLVITGRNLGPVDSLTYCNGTAARTSLLSKGWTIYGDSMECPSPPCIFDLSGIDALVLDSTQAAIVWDANPDAGFFKIQYRLKNDTIWTLQNVKNTSFHRTFHTLRNLVQDTTYEYRVREQCPDLTAGPYSPIQEFTTYSSSATCGIPSKSYIGFTPTASTVVFLTNYEPNATKYNVRWREVGTSGPIDSKVTTKSRTAMTGLSPATDYEYRYRALCSGIWTGYSTWKPFTTNAAAPPIAPRSFADSKLLDTENLLIYPNPIHDILNVEIVGAGQKRLRLLDMSGRIIIDRMIQEPQEQIDMKAMASGAYLLQVIFENGEIRSQKVLKL